MTNAEPPLVIYIEDDIEDQELCQFALEKSQMDINMQFIGDGQGAMAYFDGFCSDEVGRQRPKLVLLDLNMPAISGWDLLRHIRAKPELRCVPVLVFTTSHAPRDLRLAYEEGANAYMVKPAGLDALTECFETTMRYWLHTVVSDST